MYRQYCFIAATKVTRGICGDYSYHQLMRTHHALCSARLYRSIGRAKVVEIASSNGELSDEVCEIAENPAKKIW